MDSGICNNYNNSNSICITTSMIKSINNIYFKIPMVVNKYTDRLKMNDGNMFPPVLLLRFKH